MAKILGAVALGLGFILLNLTGFSYGALQVGFYRRKCGRSDVEAIVRRVVAAHFVKDRTITPALLRMQFHDCFVRGCDASILLDGSNSEKTSGTNSNVRGFQLIDIIKAALEKACPGVVSCADIIVLATRDAVNMAGGERYIVPTGRRDGFISLSDNVDIPPPEISVTDAIAFFAQKGLNTLDMVHLFGAHTVGVTHCSFILDRLFDLQGQRGGKPDPTMDPRLSAVLKRRCPLKASVDSPVNLDQNLRSANIVDNSFYKEILIKRGILQIDQELALDRRTRPIVVGLANGTTFPAQFGSAMIKMGSIGVLTGRQGEIRKSCRAVNPHSHRVKSTHRTTTIN
ncbi:peroxidase 60-like [Macadamia integrifolia]|uniref:peroxidase 60-like n=1 Tax=Macadamia integrifolia TaxID=60698 RepID=UPI001C4E8A74|nr:peroxidase 60-like [Macadamia integrifolia]